VDPAPSFADALRVQRVLEAVEQSAETGRWHEITPTGAAAPA
jgi:hypothetical protein